MIKKFNNFVKESVENKGKGPGDQDLIPTTPKKQTINRAIPTMDFLRIGKHILTKKIDGFIDSVQNESVYIADRITGEIKKYTFKEVIKEITGTENKISSVEGFTGTPKWAEKPKIIKEKLDDDTDALIGDTYNDDLEKKDWNGDDEENYQEDKLRGTEDNPTGKNITSNESWTKYWENFNKNQQEIQNFIEDEEDDEIDDFVDDEVEVEEEIIGSEDNPIEAKKRPRIEEYSEENPEPLLDDITN